jgi:AraC-like DNA-binding protein
MSVQPVPVERYEFHSSDPAVAETVIRNTYTGYRPKISGSTENFSFEVHGTSAGGVSLDHIAHSMAMSVATDPFSRLMFFTPAAGSLGVTWGDQEAQLGPGDAVLYPVGVPLELSWTPLRTEILSIPVEAAERTAAEESGHDHLHFVGMTPVSASTDRLWRSTVGFVTSQLESPDSPLSEPLVLSETLTLIADAALKAFPNTTMTDDYVPGPGRVAPTALRRAVDYIDANAGMPITLADIAGVASASPPALQRAFALAYGIGPMDHLRRVRLERAHLDLQGADPTTGATVSSIAIRWAFLNVSDFSRTYTEAYGQSPSDTLSS